MSPPDVRTFVARWHEAAAKADTLPCPPADLPIAEQRLLAQFDSRPQLRTLATSPLLCAMLCSLNLERRAATRARSLPMLPSTRAASGSITCAICHIWNTSGTGGWFYFPATRLSRSTTFT